MNMAERQDSVLAVGILIAALLLLYAIIIMPAFSKRNEYAQQIEELQFQYIRFNKLANQRDNIREQLDNLRQHQTDTSGFLEDKPVSLAAAELQNRIKNIIESRNGNLISAQVVQHDSNAPFPEIRIRFQIRAGIETLQQVFYALESGKPTLLLDNIYLQKRNRRVSLRSAKNNRGEQQAELIDARFEVTGYIFHSNADSKS